MLTIALLFASQMALATVPASEPISSVNTTSDTLKEDKKEETIRLSFGVGYYRMINRVDYTLSGLEVDAGLTFALNKRFAFGGKVGQGFTLGGRSAAQFTMVAAELEIMLSGSLIDKSYKSELYGTTVLTNRFKGVHGFRMNVRLNQYFFSTSQASVPFSGAGFGFSYEFPFFGIFTAKAGVDVEYILGGNFSTQPLKAFFASVFVF